MAIPAVRTFLLTPVANNCHPKHTVSWQSEACMWGNRHRVAGTYLALSPPPKNPPPIQHRRELFPTTKPTYHQPSSLCRNVRRSSREELYTPPYNQSRCLTRRARRTLARRLYVHPPRLLQRTRTIAENGELLTGYIEGPQDQDHPVLAQGQVPREGLRRAPRARQEQGPPRQGPRPPAHQVPQDHHPQDPQR